MTTSPVATSDDRVRDDQVVAPQPGGTRVHPIGDRCRSILAGLALLAVAGLLAAADVIVVVVSGIPLVHVLANSRQLTRYHVATAAPLGAAYLTRLRGLLAVSLIGVVLGAASATRAYPGVNRYACVWMTLTLLWWLWTYPTLCDTKAELALPRLLDRGSVQRRLAESARVMWAFGADGYRAPPFSTFLLAGVAVAVVIVAVTGVFRLPHREVKLRVFDLFEMTIAEMEKPPVAPAPPPTRCYTDLEAEAWLRQTFSDPAGAAAVDAWKPWAFLRERMCVTGVPAMRVGPWWRLSLGLPTEGLLVVNGATAYAVLPGYVTVVASELADLSGMSRRFEWGLGTGMVLYHNTGACSLALRYNTDESKNAPASHLPAAVAHLAIARAGSRSAFPWLVSSGTDVTGRSSYVVRMFGDQPGRGAIVVETITVTYDVSSHRAELADGATATDFDPCPSLTPLWHAARALDDAVDGARPTPSGPAGTPSPAATP